MLDAVMKKTNSDYCKEVLRTYKKFLKGDEEPESFVEESESEKTKDSIGEEEEQENGQLDPMILMDILNK